MEDGRDRERREGREEEEGEKEEEEEEEEEGRREARESRAGSSHRYTNRGTTTSAQFLQNDEKTCLNLLKIIIHSSDQ